MKTWLSALIFAVALQSTGCRKAVFKNIEEPRGTAAGDLINGGNGSGDGEGQPDASGKALIVTVPVNELPFGGKTTQATAKLKDGSKPPVDWHVEDPTGKPIGTIDSDGTFKTPEDGTPTTVKIIATLKTDPSVRGEVPLKLVPQALIVSVPVPQIKVGGNTVTAVAELQDGTKNPPVTWSISSPVTGDIGKIDVSTGVYTSPATGTMSFSVIITAKLIADPAITGSTSIQVVPLDGKGMLTVTTPSPEIRAGEEKMQATAKLNTQTTPPDVNWTIMGPAGQTDIGTIDSKGVYTSPKSNSVISEFPLVIKATLKSDPSIFGTTTIKVLPNEKDIFTKCTQAGAVLPIVADVYEIVAPVFKTVDGVGIRVESLPDFSKPEKAVKRGTVCMERYAVDVRKFDQGFPGLNASFIEWFALNTRTKLVIPEDGDYTFILNSDDGARLYIDGNEVINHDGLRRAYGSVPVCSPDGSDKSILACYDFLNDKNVRGKKTVRLKKGVHDLTLNYFQGPKYSIALELMWIRPGSTTEEYVPRTSFQ